MSVVINRKDKNNLEKIYLLPGSAKLIKDIYLLIQFDQVL